jgi:hypothetical protein
LILSDANIGVVAAGSAIAQDLRLRERLHEMPMEEFPGQPMLGKRPTPTQPDTKAKRTYPTGGTSLAADTLRSACRASASPSYRAESPLYSLGIERRFSRTQQLRQDQHWRHSRVHVAVARSRHGVVLPVCCRALVLG